MGVEGRGADISCGGADGRVVQSVLEGATTSISLEGRWDKISVCVGGGWLQMHPVCQGEGC